MRLGLPAMSMLHSVHLPQRSQVVAAAHKRWGEAEHRWKEAQAVADDLKQKVSELKALTRAELRKVLDLVESQLRDRQ